MRLSWTRPPCVALRKRMVRGALTSRTLDIIGNSYVYHDLWYTVPPMKGGVPMGSLQFTDMQSRPTEFLDFTSVTLDEFQQLVPSFEAAFQAHMAAWRLDGQPRTARRFAV